MITARLLAITPPQGAIDADAIDRWLDGGAGGRVALWLRTPGAAPQAVLERCAAIVARARARSVPVLLGLAADALASDPALPARAGLHGVVLRGDPDRAALQAARAAVGPRWLLRSCHDPAAADHDCVDATVLAPIHAPHTAKPGRPAPALGLPALARMAASAGSRVFALGGVDRHNAAACMRAGAWGLGGIRSFFGPADEVAQDVAAFCTALQTASHGQASEP